MYSIKQYFFCLASLCGAAALLLFASLYNLQQAIHEVEIAHKQQYSSYLLADELRQSSDDLTRLSRTYVATGDINYKQQYLEVLAIRNGKKPRPENYHQIFWDFVAAGNTNPRPRKQTIALVELMKRTGFTKKELETLKKAKKNSDGLVALEVEAMKIIEGKGANSQFSDGIDWKKASDIVHSKQYHKFKANIMQPVHEFYTLLENRTKARITSAENDTTHYELMTALSTLLLIATMIILGAFIFMRGIKGFKNIETSMKAIVEGDLQSVVKGTNRTDEIGTMAKSLLIFRNKLLENQELQIKQEQENISRITRMQKITRLLSSLSKGSELLIENSEIEDIEQIDEAKSQLDTPSNEDGTDTLTKAIETMQEILETQIVEITRLAFEDDLTKLENRVALQRDIKSRLSKNNANNQFALINLDLDNFKRINDTLGHAAGDHLLAVVGRRLSTILNELKCGTAYRWGGDEFLIIIETANVDIEDICYELIDVINATITYEGNTIVPTASLGIAHYPDNGTTLEDLMVHSDIALYKAKHLGRDGFHFFTNELKQKIDDDALIEKELHIALEEKQIFLVYQPQVDAETHKITGIESLVRWQHPEHGIISPGQFIPIAESHNIAPKLGRYIINEACEAARKWQNLEIDFGQVSINLSPNHIKTGTIAEDFSKAMNHHNVQPQYIAAEVLESLFLDSDNPNQNSFIEELRKLGISLELDDFGTGYASLSHLSTLPVDGLKIDKSFVDSMLFDKRKMVVIEAIFSMAKLMNLRLVCEGIETKQQYEALTKCGNCSIQGYYFSRPMPFDEITQWMEIKNHNLTKDKLVIVA